MPMMVLNDESFDKEISKFDSTKVINEVNESKEITSLDLLNRARGQVVDIKRGRGSILQVPDSIRALVAEEAINGASNKDTARAFGVSESSVSAYKNDATSTKSYNSPDEALKNANDLVRDDISSQARSKLLAALDHITDDKLSEAKLRDVASVAASMSGIIKNMEPNGPAVQNNTQVIVYKPRMRDEDEFEIITVNE